MRSTLPLSMADRWGTIQRTGHSVLIPDAACASTQQAKHPLSIACSSIQQKRRASCILCMVQAVACSSFASHLRLVVVYGAENLAG